MPSGFLCSLLGLSCALALLGATLADGEAPETAEKSDASKEEAKPSQAVLDDADFWIGTAPFCKATADDCETFDLKFIREDSTGNGAKCWTGKKVLCQQKQLKSEFVTSSNNELVVAVYNVDELSFSEEHNGQTERTCHIPRALLSKYPDLDVIILVGLFVGGCMQNGQSKPPITMGLMLTNYGFGQASTIVGESTRGITETNGGVVIVSRWPMISTREHVFANYAGLDRFIERGAVYGGINKHGVIYHVVGTQLQSGVDKENIRLEQAKEVANFISELELPSSHPVIISGDFQTDYLSDKPAAEKLFNTMFASTMPAIVSEVRVNVDYQSNDLVEPGKNDQEWRDYALFSNRHLPADQATLETSLFTADKDIRYCTSAVMQPTYVSAGAMTCASDKTTKQLSDHYPIIGRFTFNTNEQSAPMQYRHPTEQPSYTNETSSTN
ncbi:hypothetical protein BOX15_Mlig017582g1 [Macrostomum lignano]|uniref:Uncharacterized protein n=2 Tax=Macrostomum lignano TaxID=282301 RepID=A0A267GU78_9PLAT|nr:hypothetical protein BOX15_Mlig017582g1 [Macrostomum lignano]